MATSRSLSSSSVSALSSVPALPSGSAAPHPAPAAAGTARHRLRAVDRDEVVDVTDFLPPGATWLPAPPHTLPTLPGQPPMVGYLVLVPADQQPPFLPLALAGQPQAQAAAPAQATPAGATDAVPAAPAVPEAGEPLVRIDDVQRTASVNGRQLDLTYLEFELLAHLVAHPHRVHTRDQLVTTVWGYGHVGDGRTVDVHVARLRRKLGVEHRKAIQTVRRVGYKYTPPTSR
ncbi:MULTISPECIES: winged helix-turn-helix domain-containing protein [unclassified Streptomyces]|uniref:winged helix-turn-helix domain-containing protein n=1 Tax=unclassified Streptomyces TaxID=2593676 RepID=UPI0038074A32